MSDILIDSDLANNRVRNATRNAVIGVVYAIVVSVVPFVLRTLIERTLGADYLGINSLFASVMQTLNVTELGFGSVMVFFLFRPIAERDSTKIDSYLAFLRRVYYVIGSIIFVIGICIMPFVDRLIAGEIPQGADIHLLFFYYLIGTVLNYFIHPEVITLLCAYQRNDLNSRINLYSNIALYILQIVSICLFASFELYMMALIVQALITGLLRRRYTDLYWHRIRTRGAIDTKIRRGILDRVKYIAGHQLDAQLINGIDASVISAFCGLRGAAIYGNYFFVVSAVTMLFEVCYQAISSGIGNALVTEDTESNYKRFRCMFWISACMGGWGTTMMLCLYQDFMRLWMPHLMAGTEIVILMCTYFYVSQLRKTILVFKNAAGIWKEDAAKPYVAMTVNLILDLMLIYRYGIIGAISASIVCVTFIEIPLETKVLFERYFKRSCGEFIKDTAVYSLVSLFLLTVCYMISEGLQIVTFTVVILLKTLLICVIIVGAYYVIYSRSIVYKTVKESFAVNRRA